MRVIPEFVKIFKKPKPLSIENGKSHFLTRPPFESKDKVKLNKTKEETKDCYAIIDMMDNQIKKLKEKLESMENVKIENEENLEKLSKLFDLWVIYASGKFIDNSMH